MRSFVLFKKIPKIQTTPSPLTDHGFKLLIKRKRTTDREGEGQRERVLEGNKYDNSLNTIIFKY